MPAALTAAQQLLHQCEQAGTDVYTGADYDSAIAHFLLGRILGFGGAAGAALPYLREAQQRFEALGERGANMASVAFTEQGDCLMVLGRLDEATVAYQEAIKRAEELKDTRGVAVKKGQLATVYLLQKNYIEALNGYQEVLKRFQQLNEPRSVAAMHHQIGMVYKQQNQFELAESAYKQSLAIETRQKNRAGEASSLGELGNLYTDWNRPELAVDYYRQVADIYQQLGDQRMEGSSRSNLANILIKLNHLAAARPELLRAIECKKPFGHAAKPWATWAILHDLERAEGNPTAVRAVRQQDSAEKEPIEQVIAQLFEREDWQDSHAYLHALKAILNGERNPALADDETMHYQQVAELQWLLEQLQSPV